MNAAVIILSCLLSVIFSGMSFAEECWTDRDCPGARCIKSELEGAKGVCGESGEGAQSSKPLFRLKHDTDTKKPERNTKGKMCFSNADCDSGQACEMKPGQMYGVCR